MKYLKVLLLFLLIFVLFRISAGQVFAINDPASVSNNHFGIHVADTSDLSGVSQLVNSNGGDWGYVTFVIQKGERDPKRWQDAFDQMRNLHLIPIVRIATQPVGNNKNNDFVWEKPSNDEIDGWISFLNSLNWVVKNRYVIVGNEPNHAEEWGGKVDPVAYADYLKLFSQKLKASNPDFFIMPAGFDASATNTKTTMEESLYLGKMFEEDPQVFQYIDGWASHSYPNPDFSGAGDGSGKGTVSTFDWELNYLKFLGVGKNLPVFITETGWKHEVDSLTTDIPPKIQTAFEKIWSDKRVIAITPFIYKYTGAPFDSFSFINNDGQFYDFYNTMIGISKIAGKPIQEVKGDIITGIVPKIAMSGASYHSVLFIKNTGQSIWQTNNISAINEKDEKLTIKSMFPNSLEPQEIGIFLIDGKFPNIAGSYETSITITNETGSVTQSFQLSVNLIPGVPNLSEIITYLKAVIGRKIGL